MSLALQHLAGRVWLYPADPDPDNVAGSVAVIAGDAASTVVDAGNSPVVARLVQAAMVDAGLPAAGRLVYTHHHWDHTWGACAWNGVEVVGHETGRDLMAAEARRPWSHRYLREQVAANPRLGPSGHDLAQLNALLAEGFDWYVDSHGDPWRRTDPPVPT